MSRVLDVYLKDRKAGELMQDRDASLTFTYEGDFLSSDPVALSVSLTDLIPLPGAIALHDGHRPAKWHRGDRP
jgi:hypothetical protein